LKIASARVRAIRLPLRRPLVTSTHTLEVRDGFVLLLEGEDGLIGHGEASPVWWADGESLAAAGVALDEIVHACREGELDDEGLLAVLGPATGAGGERESELLAAIESTGAPSGRAALETALLDLAARRAGVSVAAWLAAREVTHGPAARLEVNALATASDPDGLAAEAEALVARGFATIKVKVGAVAPEQDVARVAGLRRGGAGEVRLRLDANRAWDPDDARRVLDAVAGEDVDYVEEPLAEAHPEALARLREQSGAAIAVDESLGAMADLEELGAAGACDVVVLKPARLGGPTRTLGVARRARELGLRVVLTDSIESAVGRAATAHVAAVLPVAGAIGLGGASVLAADVVGEGAPALEPRVEIEGPGLGIGAVATGAVAGVR